MDKKYFIGFVALTLISVVYFILTEDEVSQKGQYNLHKENSGIKPNTETTTAIVYSTTESPKESVVSPAGKDEKNKVSKPEWPADVESRTYTHEGTYQISVINPNKVAEKYAESFVAVNGRIDGYPFVAKIPESLVGEGADNISIEIKNLQTGQTVEVPVSFMDDLRDRSRHSTISVRSDDPENFEYVSEESILPVPGEQYIVPSPGN